MRSSWSRGVDGGALARTSKRTLLDLTQSGPAICSSLTRPYANLMQSTSVALVRATSPLRMDPRLALYVSPGGGGLGLREATSNDGAAGDCARLGGRVDQDNGDERDRRD